MMRTNDKKKENLHIMAGYQALSQRIGSGFR